MGNKLVHKISLLNHYIEYEFSKDLLRQNNFLISHYGDLLPLPKKIGVSNYTYLTFIFVAKNSRHKGFATKLINLLLSKINTPIYTELINSDITNGTILTTTLKKLKFKTIKILSNKITLLKK